MGGWVGGGKIKNKDQLSLAEARVEAELGKTDKILKKLDQKSDQMGEYQQRARTHTSMRHKRLYYQTSWG